MMEALKGQKLTRDEYETTAMYNARVASYSGKQFTLEFPLELATPRIGAKPTRYDADTQVLEVGLIGHSELPPVRVFDLQATLGMRGAYVKFYLRNDGPKEVKQYTATNAMGATTTVTQMLAVQRSVALLNALVPSNLALLRITGVPPHQAKQLIQQLRWRIEVRTAIAPNQRQFVLEDGNYFKPTIASPYEYAIDGQTFTASMLSAKLIDSATGQELGAYVTSPEK